jgi:hypothetical protein
MLRRQLGALRREVGRQSTARTNRLVAPQASPGTVWLTRRRVPVNARVDPGLRLDQQREATWDAVGRLLADAGIAYWSQPEPGRNPVLCVDVEDRARLLELLPTIGGSSWYVDAIRPNGLALRQPQPVAARVGRGRLSGAAGLVVHELVVAGRESRFLADEWQGVRILFWQHEEDGLVCLSATATARTMPPGWSSEGMRGEVPSFLRVRPTATVPFPIDVVYTWVDGDDDAWLRTKAEAVGGVDPTLFTERAHDASRYADHDELRYSLRALEQFAPWVTHVWVVTADQHPPWLQRDHPWVSVVSHRDLWRDDPGLPTFNSHAIETCLHRIPGLAEHFLYLNDDMLLGRPVRPDHFFHPNGVGKFFWSRALVDHAPSRAGDIASTSAAKNARRLIEERYAVTFTRKFFHTAAALTVSGLEELEREFPDAVARSREARFRTLDDVAMAGSLYHNWAYVTGRAVPSRLRYTYIDPAGPNAAARLDRLVERRNLDAFCVNDGSSEETVEQRRATDRLIRDFFADFLPVPGSFEVTDPR